MPRESEHDRTKRQLCIGGGQTEARTPSGQRVDCQFLPTDACYEVERHKTNIPKAIERLESARSSGMCDHQYLVVPDVDITHATRRAAGTNVKVMGLSEVSKHVKTRRQSAPLQQKAAKGGFSEFVGALAMVALASAAIGAIFKATSNAARQSQSRYSNNYYGRFQ